MFRRFKGLAYFSRYFGRIAIAYVVLFSAGPAAAQPITCGAPDEYPQVQEALRLIRESVDPCGESQEITNLLDGLARCTATAYQVCPNPTSRLNFFDRPVGARSRGLARTLVWNPTLRTPLEIGCDGDPARPVARDPVASLLHELVHAAQDCQGLNPSEHELEAVRIENIYRRAVGLCQRTRYGSELLPTHMVRSCEPSACMCSAAEHPQMIEAPPANPVRPALSSADAAEPDS